MPSVRAGQRCWYEESAWCVGASAALFLFLLMLAYCKNVFYSEVICYLFLFAGCLGVLFKFVFYTLGLLHAGAYYLFSVGYLGKALSDEDDARPAHELPDHVGILDGLCIPTAWLSGCRLLHGLLTGLVIADRGGIEGSGGAPGIFVPQLLSS